MLRGSRGSGILRADVLMGRSPPRRGCRGRSVAGGTARSSEGGVAERRAGVGAGRARDHRVWGGRGFGGVDVRRATAVGLGRARGSNAGAGVADRRATSVII